MGASLDRLLGLGIIACHNIAECAQCRQQDLPVKRVAAPAHQLHLVPAKMMMEFSAWRSHRRALAFAEERHEQRGCSRVV